MKAHFVSFTVLATLVGCVTGVAPIELDEVQATLEVDVSTKAEALELLGSPTATYRDGLQQLYELRKGVLILIPASHVGFGAFTSEHLTFLVLEFDANGILRGLDIEKTKFIEAGPVETKMPLAKAFVVEAEEILNAHVVSWYMTEQGCNAMGFWTGWGQDSWDQARQTQAALALGSDFVGIAEWQDDGRYDVKWMAKDADLVSVTSDSFGLNKCVVLEARNLPTIMFSIPSESVWLNTDRKRVESVLGDLLKKVASR